MTFLKDFEKRPIRKRGFHRALKRGETWAVISNRLRTATIQYLSVDLFKQKFFGPSSEKNED